MFSHLLLVLKCIKKSILLNFFLGKETLQKNHITKSLMLNKVVLDENKNRKLVTCLKSKMSLENFHLHLTISKIFFLRAKTL